MERSSVLFFSSSRHDAMHWVKVKLRKLNADYTFVVRCCPLNVYYTISECFLLNNCLNRLDMISNDGTLYIN